jgi:hypothetical protein
MKIIVIIKALEEVKWLTLTKVPWTNFRPDKVLKETAPNLKMFGTPVTLARVWNRNGWQ